MRRAALRAGLLASSALVAVALSAAAQDATWNLNGTGDFNTATNWTPGAVPAGTAFFGVSNQNNVSFSANTGIDGWTFNAGASNYTFTNSTPFFLFSGAGITINGGSATIINNGTLYFDNFSTADSAAITNNGNLYFERSSTAGSAAITNNNNMAFFSSGTAGNATITNNSSFGLTFYNSSTAGTAIIINNGNMAFADVSTAGGATITNAGNTAFNGTSTAGSAIIANSGNLFFLNSSTAGNATISNTLVITFFDSSTAGSATITNNNSLGFFNNSTAGNATITNNASMGFLNAGTAGNATIANNGNLQFADSSTGGNATITNNIVGVVDFSQSSGPASDGKLTAGSIAGAGRYYLGASELSVGGNNLSTTVSGSISDCGPTGTDCLSGPATGGALVKVGTGTLTLAGLNTYTGATTVNDGTLVVDGSIATSALTIVNNGGTLAGIGTVGNAQINPGGILAPGRGSPGTAMTVAGNLAFQSGAIYLVQVDPTAASRVDAATANLTGGSVQANFAPGSYMGRQYTILHTSAPNGLGGTQFADFSSNANFAAGLSYVNDQDVILNLTAVLGQGSRLNVNQQNVVNAINGFFNNGNALPPNFVSLFGLTGGNLANTLSLLSGEAGTGAQQGAFQLNNQFLGLMLDPSVDGRSGITGAAGPALGFAPEQSGLPDDIALAYARITKAPVYKAPSSASFEQRWSVWGGGFGGYNKTDGDAAVVGNHDLTARTAGFAAGMDYRVAPDRVVGFALAGGGTRWGLAGGLGGGRSDAFQAGVYGVARSGPAYVAASLAFANHWMSTDRAAPFGGRLTADFDAQSFGARLEGGYRFDTPFAGITPYGAVQAQSFRTPSYSEIDVTSGGYGLTYNSRDAHDVRSEFGGRIDHVTLINPSAVLTLRGRLAWAHDWVSDPALIAVFQALPGASFVVNGAVPTRDAALTSAGAELRLAKDVTLLARFDGEFAGRSNTYAGTGAVRVNW